MKKLFQTGTVFFVLFFIQGIQLCLCKNSTSGWCIEEERQALLILKRSFEDPSNRLVSWAGEDCCRWSGLSCSKINGHVIKLDLRAPLAQSDFDTLWWYMPYDQSDKLYASEISSSLVELKHLEYLDLSGNDFNQSRIPEFLGSLKRLRYLNLSNTELTGAIPHQLGNISRLQALDLGGENFDVNQLLVSDNFQWASTLLSLQQLEMSLVDLSKAVDLFQVLNKLPSLLQLRLNECGIRNSHFLSVGSVNSTFLPSVRFLSLKFNPIGELPNALRNLTELRELDLSYQGGVYAENLQWLSSFSSLQRLDMSYVNLSQATDLIHVLNTLPSLIDLTLERCEIQNLHFSKGSFNSTFLARVQFLALGSNSLRGPLLNFFRNMSALREIDLSRNEFNSTIPLELVESKSLVKLDLSSNLFDGVEGGVLSIISRSCSLKSLDLSYNPFSGEVFGSENTPSRCFAYNLESLSLGGSGINGTIPAWSGQLKALQYLILEGNSFSGPIPAWFGELKALQVLSLGGNSFSGPIPVLFGKLMALRYLYLGGNSFSGPIPHSLGNLSSLSRLDLSYNNLQNEVPQSLGKISTLEVLGLSNNRLTGIVPGWLWIFPRLRAIDLSNNQFRGTIPQFIQRFTSLQWLDLSHNELSGTIPESLGVMSNLERLDLSNNHLEGNVSEFHFSNMSLLEELILSSNHLNCDINSDWSPPFSLRIMNMSSCMIGSEFPRWIQTQPRLYKLDLSNSNISGAFPIDRLSSRLMHLDLSKNQISGELPANIEEAMPIIDALFLGNNQLKGSLPNSFCKLGRLQVLDLSENELSGEIPDCWQLSQGIYVINLSFNKFSGTIPGSIGNLSILKWLHLNGNNLRGELPLALRYCMNLELLDLGENSFSGVIPAWIGERLSSLKILRLRDNSLTGNIPQQLCLLSELQILDLAINGLSGGIPRCFGRLIGMSLENGVISEPPTAMTVNSAPAGSSFETPPLQDNTQWPKEKVSVYTKGTPLEYTTTLLLVDGIDLSSNRLTGSIPEELSALSGLRSLNLSHNYLIGTIPNQIGNLKVIESLDLSDNRLFGPIPPSIAQITTLNHLNLSYNDLSGKIPTGNQLQTLNDASIYFGNDQLCGDPLLKKCPGEDEPAGPPTSSGNELEDKREKILFWFIVTIGYATGLWGVIGALAFKRNWRIGFFRFADNAKDQFLVMVAVKAARLKQRIRRIFLKE